MKIEQSITSKIETLLTFNGFFYSHNLDGWDNHYYSQNEKIPYDIIFDAKHGDFIVYKRTSENVSFKNEVYNISDTEITYENINNLINKLKNESINS